MKLTEENKITIINAVITLSELCSEHTCGNCPLMDEYGRCDLAAIEGVNIASLNQRLNDFEEGD